MKESYKEPYDFLSRHHLAILSTSDGKNDVWGAAIYYAVDESLTFYFFTKTGSKKYHNILKNPQVAITIVDDDAQATVQASGRAEEVSEGHELNDAYRRLVQVHPPGEFSWKPPVSKLEDSGSTAVFRLQPTMLQFAEFKSDSGSNGSRIKRII